MSGFFKNKTILITGGTGFLGSNAIKYFSKLPVKKIVAATSQLSDSKINRQIGELKKTVEVTKANLLNPKDALKVVKNVDIILHFAAIDGSLDFKKNNSADIFSQNMRINLNILEAAAGKVESFLLVSTSDIYTSVDEPITESTPIEISWKKDVDGYKLSKWSTELAAREFFRQYKLPVTIIRPGNIYGPGDDFEEEGKARFIPSVMRRAYNNLPVTLWGSGVQSRSFLYVDDLMKITHKLMEKQNFNLPINVASKKSIKLKKLATEIGKTANKKIKVEIDKTKPSGALRRDFDLSLLKSLIGDIKETDIATGLYETHRFFEKHYR